jgi:hypothetical protein
MKLDLSAVKDENKLRRTFLHKKEKVTGELRNLHNNKLQNFVFF